MIKILWVAIVLLISYVKCQSQPLILTNLLNSGNYQDAQTQSRVTLSEFPNIESYSGYFKVSEASNSNLFFWFFKSENNFETNPVILNIQGGPGLSSLVSLYLEIGPFNITPSGNVVESLHSWTKMASVIFIDNPVNTGFSFGDVLPTNLNEITQGLHEGVKQFYKLFPQLRTNKFYIMGESYAGKYVPRLGKMIHQANSPNSNENINIRGIAVGNGMTDPLHQSKYCDFFYHTGLCDNHCITYCREREIAMVEHVQAGEYDLGRIASSDLLDRFVQSSGYSNFYNFLEQNGPNAPLEERLITYLSGDSIKSALHVGSTRFELYNVNVAPGLTDYFEPIPQDVEYLLGVVDVLIYNGQYDIVIPYVSTVNYLRNLNFDGSTLYRYGDRTVWRMNGDVVGYVTKANRLTEVLIRNAGHMSPMDQPLVAYTMMEKFINNGTF
ncbi:hypothetical protein RI129_009709 [Pyrocoelia pectoralis]|uniref:Carboxypeptidase n=1 Tax=Pyrocoelia pectoralis TaxID=417401 RepID=A0AAN7ZF56_9COLE